MNIWMYVRCVSKAKEKKKNDQLIKKNHIRSPKFTGRYGNICHIIEIHWIPFQMFIDPKLKMITGKLRQTLVSVFIDTSIRKAMIESISLMSHFSFV